MYTCIHIHTHTIYYIYIYIYMYTHNIYTMKPNDAISSAKACAVVRTHPR